MELAPPAPAFPWAPSTATATFCPGSGGSMPTRTTTRQPRPRPRGTPLRRPQSSSWKLWASQPCCRTWACSCRSRRTCSVATVWHALACPLSCRLLPTLSLSPHTSSTISSVGRESRMRIQGLFSPTMNVFSCSFSSTWLREPSPVCREHWVSICIASLGLWPWFETGCP